jgi:hypothetical protein
MKEAYVKWSVVYIVAIALYGCTAQKEAALQGAVVNATRDSVISRYRIADEYAGTSIELKTGNVFAFVSWDCKTKISSQGSWRRAKDTLILHSDFQQDDMPVRLSFKRNAADDSLKILLPKDATGRDLAFVTVMLNNDSTTSFLTAADSLVFVTGYIHSIQFNFGYQALTKWLTVPKGIAGEIHANLDFAIERLPVYYFMKEERYLAKGKKLYQIVDDGKAGNNGVKIRSKYYFSKTKL